METIGMSTATTTTTTTTSGGEIDSRISSSGGVSCCSKVAPTVASPSIDFQSSSEQQQQQQQQQVQQEIGLLGEETKSETVKTDEPVQDQEPKLGENVDTTASPVQILNSNLSSNSSPRRTCETRGGDVGLKVDSDCDGDGHGHGHANGDGVECKDSHKNSKSAQNESEKRKTANHSNCVSVSDEKQKREDGDNDSPTTPVVPCSAPSVTNLVTVATTDTETGNSAATSCCTHNNNHHHHSSPRRISSSKSHETDETLDNRLGSTPTPTPPIVPNFCVEGSGDGDSSVTVVTLPSSAGLSGSLISGSGGVIVGVVNSSSCLSSSLASDISCSSGGTSRDGTIEVDEDDCDNCEEDHDIVGLGGNGSGPLSVQSSEDMKLSLVSWYSEPEDSSRGCCQANLLARCVNNIDAVVSSTPKSKPKSSAAGCCSNKSSSKKTNHHHHHHHHISSGKSETNGDADGSLSVVGGSCDEKENKTPVRAKGSHVNSNSNSKGKTASKMHVQLLEQQNCGSSSAGVEICSEVGVVGDGHGHGGGGHQSLSQAKTKKLECPRCCARRSKSGTTTPANGPPSRTLRRVVQSSKSSGELKKPIKSILKSDSRGSGSRSGSGSEKQSSMDSLGSSSGIACVMTRSEGSGGVGRTKFNFNSESLSSSSYSPEEKTASKLKRIEKYATLRLRKSRVKPLEFDGGDGGHAGCPMSMSNSVDSHCHGHCTCKHEGSTPDVMSKSMSFLEKSTSHCTSSSNHNNSNGTPGPSSLKRQGSLRIRKPSPMWEPSGTRTSALRMQKMQEAKAKTSSGNSYYNNNSSMGGKILFSNHQSNHSGSNHSGSGESIHTQHHHHNHHGAQNGHQNGGHGHSHSSSNNNNNNNYSSSSSHNNHKCPKEKQQHLGAKVFTKLSSASGQTTSSAMKRLRQERAVQTDPPLSAFALSPVGDGTGNSPIRISPVPAYDQDHADDSEQIKNLEILAQRYRNTALRFQHEFEKSEVKNRELAKQLAETQSETSEMIDFLQAEKSTLAESLVEIENEGKKWQDEVDSVKKESQSRCSSLVRLSEQHKQEALKSQALLNRLEAQSNTIISKQSSEISEAALTIQQTRLRIVTLIEKLLKTYKVSHELITAATTTTDSNSTSQSGNIPINSSDETDLNSSLLLPLISSLLNAFPMNPLSPMLKSTSSNDLKNSCSSHNSSKYGSKENDASSVVTTVVVVDNGVKPSSVSAATTSSSSSAGTTRGCDGGEGRGGSEGLSNSHSNLSSSLQNLNQAILEREAAEMDFNSTPSSGGTESGLESIHDGDHLSIKTETEKLNRTLAQLVTTIRIIVIHCDKKVSGVTSNILQCLRSIEEEKGGKIPEMVSVQKSLEAWSGGMRQCNSKVTSPTTKIFLENGHSHA